MPTYRNETGVSQIIGYITIHNGEEKELNRYVNIPGMIKVSDEPYYNPVISIDEIEFVGPEDKIIDINIEQAKKINIYGISGTGINITVYINSKSNLPPAHSPLTLTDVFLLDDLCGRVEKIILSSSSAGKCFVKQMKE